MTAKLIITEVKIYPFDSSGKFESGSKILAYADITLNDQIIVKGFRIFQTGAGGLFVSYPSEKSKTGKYFDMVIPKDKAITSLIRDEIIKAYKEYVPE